MNIRRIVLDVDKAITRPPIVDLVSVTNPPESEAASPIRNARETSMNQP